MAFKDIRDFISILEKEGELVKIEQEVDWDLEVGAILRRCYEIKAPAPLFQKIKDYSEGYKIFGGACANFRRLTISLGMKPDSYFQDILAEIEVRKNQPIKPILVNGGPCKENIHIGDEATLYEFPAPMVHEGDGGRYIGSWHFVATKDLDSDWVNWGLYRLMIHNKKAMGIQMNPFQHIGIMFHRKYEPQNKRMEFAAALGGDPIYPIAGTMDYGIGKNEVDLAGGLRKEPVQLIKCETVDLEVPADAEIVIEGEFIPHLRMHEGPYGEFTGYRTSPREPRPMCVVKAITHRNNPILPMSCLGTPVDDGHIILSLCWTSNLETTLKDLGFPIIGICVLPECAATMVAVSIKTLYSNMATQIANAIWSTKTGIFVPYVVVLDSDVDPTNVNEVLHAISTKCHPERGIRVQKHAPGHPLVPFLDMEERLWGFNANVVFDCTWPLNWSKEVVVPQRSSFSSIYPKEVQDKVIKNWKNYGF